MVDLTSSILAEVVIDGTAFGVFGAVIGCGMIIIGAASGISKIANGATEAIARQPEAGGRIFTSMLLAAAFVEGVTLLALIVCLLAVNK